MKEARSNTVSNTKGCLVPFKVVLVVFCVAFFGSGLRALAQHSGNLGTPAESKPGQSTVSTYARDKIETVNLANGNFSLSIPLATVGGRGSASYTIALSYNSKVWSTQLDRENVATEGNPVTGPPAGIPISHNTAMYNEIKSGEFEPTVAYLGGGWTIRMAPGVKARTVGIDSVPTTQCNVKVERIPDCGFAYALTKMWLTLPDGSEVELRDSATEGAPAPTTTVTNGYHELIDRNRGRIWHSVDGSNVFFVRDATDTVVGGADSKGNSSLFFPSGWVFLPDGTRLRMGAGVGSKIIDRNGNYITIDGNGYTDELGRQTLFQTVNGVLTLIAKGYGGATDRSLGINLGVIGNLDNLRSDFRLLPRPFTTGDAKHDLMGNFYEHMIQGPHTDLFVDSEGVIAYGDEGLDVGLNTAVTQLNLMDGRSFRFRYNQYGEVAEIVYPGGGVSQIDYNGGPSSLCPASAPIHLTLNRTVSQRRTLTDGVNVDASWAYALRGGELVDGINRPTATVEVHQGDATGALLASEKHFFLKPNAEYRSCGGNFTGTGNENWQNAKEFRTETQTGTGTTVTVRDWQQRAPFVWGNDPGANSNSYVQLHGQDETANDPRVDWEETTLEDGKMKRTEYGYDDFNNVTSTREYDFGAAGSPGPLLRQTIRTYGAPLGGNYGISINGYCYSNLNPTDSSCGSGLASDVTSIIYQRHLLLNETIQDGSPVPNVKAYSEIEYDNYSSATNHAAIVSNIGMIQYDGARFSFFSGSNEPRGNVTKATHWAGGSNYISSFSQYDNAGNVVWANDSNGNVSTVSYADNFGDGSNPDAGAVGTFGATYATATLATNALGQQAKSQFNYTYGAATGAKDPNGVISKAEYDNLGRPFRTTAAAGLAEQTIVEMTYPNATAIEMTVSKQLDATRWLASRSIRDGFDRVITSLQSEDGQHANYASWTIRADTIYDAIGRVKQSSSAYRPANETAVYTTSVYDLAGRVTSITTPDNAVVSTVYNGETVTVTDQHDASTPGHSRRSVTDGLGRLVRVDEPDANNSLDVNGSPFQPTYYSYDTLDSLTTVSQYDSVSQITQTRSFVYDPLKRLTSATNPESGTISYQYDNDGNLLVKTDARSVSAHYVYDVLNRATRRWYNSSNSLSAVTNNNPALPSVVGVSDEVNYIYDSQGLPSGAPTFTRGSSTGRLLAVTYGTNSSAGDYYGYDALGRGVLKIQQIGGVNYQVSAVYNAASEITSETHPSHHAVAFAYDGAGRSTSFTGNLGDGTSRNYATGIVYDAAGRLKKEQFGTDALVYNKLWYNVRGQLSEIRESTSYTGASDTTWDRGKIINDYSLQCTGAGCNGTDNNGNLRKQTVSVPGSASWYQQYEYDSLNRLTQVNEYSDPSSLLWKQWYTYDRFGNRKIDVNHTSTTIPRPDFEVETSTNRLLAPGDSALTIAAGNISQRKMRYDAAGNLVNDRWTAAGSATPDVFTRTYDAENRMTTALDNAGGTTHYYYDAGGHRVRRVITNQPEVWQVYGLGGELLSEYAVNAAPESPQKEYGYRNGQLLITAEAATATAPPPSALAVVPSGTVPAPTVTLSWSAAAGATSYRVERKDATGDYALAGATSSTSFTDNGASAAIAYLYKVCAANSSGSCTSPYTNIALGTAMSFTDPSITSIVDDPTGVSVTTVKLEHITELRTAVNAVRHLAGMSDATWTHLTLTRNSNLSVISSADVQDLRDRLDEALIALGIQTSVYFDAALGGAPTGSWIRKIHITQLRARVTSGLGGSGGTGGTTASIEWLVADQLGTPRMIFDKAGSLAGMKRHDYLPFGEELTNQGLRTTTQGYSTGDNVRQKFTSKERDNETGLDYFLARYYSSTQGRFTSPDEFTGGPDELYSFVDDASANPTFYADLRKPQSLNKYQYTYNNPLRYIDPDGHDVEYENDRLQQQFQNIAQESKTFAGELAALNADHNIVVVVVERGLKTNDEKSSGDATITFKSDGSTRVVIAVDSYGRTPDRTKEHEVGHAKDARANREQLKKDGLATQKNKGGPAEKPHDDRPEEKRANVFREQVERERKEYKKHQEAERKRQKREKKQQEQG